MEWNDALGLNIYEMDLRQYDPAVGRWVVQDPVIHHEFSPYSAFDNNPVYWADPSGADAVPVTVMDLFNATGNGSNATFEFSNGRMISANTSAELEAFLSEVLQGALEMQPLGDVEHEISKGNGHGDGGGNGNGGGGGSKADSSDDGNRNSDNQYTWGDFGSDVAPYTWGTGLVATGLQNTPGSFRLTNGAYNGSLWSPKFYKSGWTGGSVAKITTYNIGKIGSKLGVVGFIAGLGMDIYGVSNGTTSWGKAGLNTTMGALGFTGWGTPASILYGAAEAFHPQGIEGTLRDMGEIQRIHREQNNGAGFKPRL